MRRSIQLLHSSAKYSQKVRAKLRVWLCADVNKIFPPAPLTVTRCKANFQDSESARKVNGRTCCEFARGEREIDAKTWEGEDKAEKKETWVSTELWVRELLSRHTNTHKHTPPQTRPLLPPLADLRLMSVKSAHWLFGAHRHGRQKQSSGQICASDVRQKFASLSLSEKQLKAHWLSSDFIQKVLARCRDAVHDITLLQLRLHESETSREPRLVDLTPLHVLDRSNGGAVTARHTSWSVVC